MTSPTPSTPTAPPEPAPWIRPRNNPLTLIGLAGRAGVGKDTVADYLVDMHDVLRYALANPLRAALAAAFGLGAELVDRDLKEHPVPWLGQSPRRLMQSLGDWGRELCGADVWIRVAERVVAEAEAAPELAYAPALVISDLRYDEEAAWLRSWGGHVIHLRRPGAPRVAAHSSEAGVTLLAGDLVIDNTGTLDELRDTVGEVFRTLREQDTAELSCGDEAAP